MKRVLTTTALLGALALAAGGVQAQTQKPDATAKEPADSSGAVAPPGTKVSPVPPPTSETAGTAKPGTPVPPAVSAQSGSTGGTKVSPVPPGDASTTGTGSSGQSSTSGSTTNK